MKIFATILNILVEIIGIGMIIEGIDFKIENDIYIGIILCLYASINILAINEE